MQTAVSQREFMCPPNTTRQSLFLDCAQVNQANTAGRYRIPCKQQRDAWELAAQFDSQPCFTATVPACFTGVLPRTKRIERVSLVGISRRRNFQILVQ